MYYCSPRHRGIRRSCTGKANSSFDDSFRRSPRNRHLDGLNGYSSRMLRLGVFIAASVPTKHSSQSCIYTCIQTRRRWREAMFWGTGRHRHALGTNHDSRFRYFTAWPTRPRRYEIIHRAAEARSPLATDRARFHPLSMYSSGPLHMIARATLHESLSTLIGYRAEHLRKPWTPDLVNSNTH